MKVFARREPASGEVLPVVKRRRRVPRGLKLMVVLFQYCAVVLVVIFDIWIFGNVHFPEPIAGYMAILLIATPLILIGVLVDGVRSAARRDTWLGVHVNSIIAILLCVTAFALAVGWSLITVEFDDGRLRIHVPPGL